MCIGRWSMLYYIYQSSIKKMKKGDTFTYTYKKEEE